MKEELSVGVCKNCGNKLGKHGKWFCCKSCWNEYQQKQHTVKTKCKMCKKMFEHRQKFDRIFCTHECSRRYYNLKDNPAKKPKVKEKMRQRMIKDIKLGKMKAFGHGHNPSFPGELNPRWLGGIKGKIAALRGIKRYEVWRKKVFERDNYTCQACGERGGNLHGHHLKSFTKYPDLRFEVSNGITLCVRCHAEITLRGWKSG